ncbi:MAG: HAMP domain-containing histidine kinase [Polyangiaceae bacterium]|nr:HAMP domain-containing histidine kinase [Polyangiaceae bacterium]
MKLRLRLALTTLGVAAPLIVASALGLRGLVQRADDELVAAGMLARGTPDLRAACERGESTRLTLTLPRHSGSRLFGRAVTDQVEISLLDREGRHSGSPAPEAPPDLVAALARGSPLAARTAGQRREVLVAMPWGSGPCATAFAVTRPAQPPFFAPPVVIPVMLALVAVLVGIAPLIRRILALTAAVRRFRGDTAQVPPATADADELGELARAFHDAATAVREQHLELSARERDLREFVENTSHDLATPLTVLQGHLAALERSHDPLVVRQAMDEAHYLGSLLGRLAMTAKLDAGERVEVGLDLADLVTRVVARHRSLAARHEVQLECATGDEPLRVVADPTFAEQALTNLVGNAVSYNQPGGHVAVVLDVQGDDFVLRVLDDGPGLTDDERDRVVARGERGDQARSRATAGQGLGLSIVARVAAAQGWHFSLVANEPRGLVATLQGKRSVA